MSRVPYVGAATLVALTALFLIVWYYVDVAHIPPASVLGDLAGPGDAVVRRLIATPLTSHAAVALSDQYQVKFNGTTSLVVMNRNIMDDKRGANNIAQVQMTTSDSGNYEPVRVEVTSVTYVTDDGNAWNIRPSRYWEELGKVRDIDSSRLAEGVLSFTVWEPCQLSVELGDPDILFATKNSFKAFPNLILAFNPPESSWPKAKPRLIQSGNTTSCESAVLGRACILADADDSCDELEVPRDTDIYFSSQVSRTYIWGAGCGVDTKVIKLKRDARMFLDEDVIVFARAFAGAKRAGVYGYGILSNSFMNGTTDKTKDSIVRLLGENAEVFGVTLLDATYRNIKVGERGQVQWTKSFAWETETDCVSTTAPGMRVFNNFFKVNDDCLKPYFPNTTFRDNIIWHQGVGRAIMVNWGNLGMNLWNYDGSHKVLDTYIIHDQKAWSVPIPDPPTPMPVAYHASTVGFAALIGIQHSTSNQLGTYQSHVLIENTYVEERIGIPIIIMNGFGQLNGLWQWQALDTGCTGAVHMKIKNLDMRRVTGIAAQSIAGGCDVGYATDEIENAACLCIAALNCSDEAACGVRLQIEDHSNPSREGVTTLEDSLIVGMNTDVEYISSSATETTTGTTTPTTTVAAVGNPATQLWLTTLAPSTTSATFGYSTTFTT